MTRKPKARSGTAVDDALREAFRAVEAQPVAAALTEHVDRLAGPKRRSDRRS